MSITVSIIICILLFIVLPIFVKALEEREYRKISQAQFETKNRLKANQLSELNSLLQIIEQQIEINNLKGISKNISRINSLKDELNLTNESKLLKITFFNLILKVNHGNGASEYNNIIHFLNKSKETTYIKCFAELFEKHRLINESYALHLMYENKFQTKINYLERKSTKIEFTILKKNQNHFDFKHTTELSLSNSISLQVYSLYDYFPKFVTHSKYFTGSDSNNYKIFSFKEGKYKYILNDLTKTLKKCGLFEQIYSDTVWSMQIIPSSTQSKTNLRFKNFCQEMSDSLQINNGFDAITTKDRNQYKGLKNINKIEYLHFKKDLISGKNILLFDDIITTGESFTQISNVLKDMGAKTIIGITIGKTIVPFKNKG